MSNNKRKYVASMAINGREGADIGKEKLKGLRKAEDEQDDVDRSRNPQQLVVLQEDPILPSVEDLLAVPTAFIFRKVFVHKAEDNLAAVQQSQKPLLSRSEATCFCKINLLAHELDCLTKICTDIWQTKLQYQSFSQSLGNVDHPYLRPLVVLLDTFQQQMPSSALPRIELELNRVVSELQQATVTLRQCSEQNWTLAETLQDTATAEHLLAREKLKLSDVQEEICHRIDRLISRNISGNTICNDAMDTTGSEEQCSNMSTSTTRRSVTGPLISMQEYCNNIFATESECAVMPITFDNVGGDCDNDEILSEPEGDADPVPKPHDKKRQARGQSQLRRTPSPPQKKEISQCPPIFTTTYTSTPHTTQHQPKDSLKTPAGSEEKENSQQSQRSSQSSVASNTHHRLFAPPVVAENIAMMTSRATAKLDGDELDHHSADSQDAAHVLSALAATTLARAGGS